jgi:hypothetical protein
MINAKKPKKPMIAPIPSISTLWKPRLFSCLKGILVFNLERVDDDESLTHGQSADCRTILELVEVQGVLTWSSLQLALPPAGDLEMLKLGCWTLLYLKSIFPDWLEVDSWVKEAAEWATESGSRVDIQLQGYRVSCLYCAMANVLDFQIVKAST